VPRRGSQHIPWRALGPRDSDRLPRRCVPHDLAARDQDLCEPINVRGRLVKFLGRTLLLYPTTYKTRGKKLLPKSRTPVSIWQVLGSAQPRSEIRSHLLDFMLQSRAVNKVSIHKFAATPDPVHRISYTIILLQSNRVAKPPHSEQKGRRISGGFALDLQV